MNKKCNICDLQMNHIIFNQINETCKEKSSMSCMNGNIASGKHIIGDSILLLFIQDNPI